MATAPLADAAAVFVDCVRADRRPRGARPVSTALLLAAETQAVRSDTDCSAVLVPTPGPGVLERAGHLRGVSYLSCVLLVPHPAGQGLRAEPQPPEVGPEGIRSERPVGRVRVHARWLPGGRHRTGGKSQHPERLQDVVVVRPVGEVA